MFMRGGAVLRIRKFEWADLDAVAFLSNEISGVSGTARALDADGMRAVLSVPGCDPERHCFVAELDGAAVGYCLVSYEPPISRAVAAGGVLRAHRRGGVGGALLRHAVEHAAALGVGVLHVEAGADDAAARRLLESAGMVVVKSLWKMRWEGGAAPDVRLPDGFAVRSLVAGQDEAALTDLQNTAFAENWGFSPNTVEQINVRVRHNRGGPESILFIVEDGGEGAPAGYNWTVFVGEGETASGVVAMTGVHPHYRGRGLGRAVVAAGVAYLVERGASVVDLEVDSENAPARELYLKLGFRKMGSSVWYEKAFG